MIVSIDRNALSKIENPAFVSYAQKYVEINEDFLTKIADLGVEVDSQDYIDVTRGKIERLHQKGAIVRNDDKSIYINHISPACLACQTGLGSATFFISLKCHRDCFYCFNPNQEGYQQFTLNQRDVIAELDQIKANKYMVEHLALTGGEPLLYKDKTIDFFQHARQEFPSAYTRLYTSGDHLNEQTLQELKDAGLQEIRISIRMQDLENGHRHTLDRLSLSKGYIPFVMVEMPVLPGTLDLMKDVLLQLERIGIFSINLLELCFPLNNAQDFRKRGFKIKNPPYRVLYDYWYAGGLPIAKSELECLDLLEFAIDSGLRLGVHYCSLENKHTGQIYQQNLNQPLPKTSWFSKKDYFLKSAKVFGDDIKEVLPILRKVKRARFSVNHDYNYLEFHARYIKALKDIDVDVGISTSVFESREDGMYLRELKVDYTNPKLFDFEMDV
jgi:pyruvate formate-lyase activating enzyme-like uncharacterized protein